MSGVVIRDRRPIDRREGNAARRQGHGEPS